MFKNAGIRDNKELLAQLERGVELYSGGKPLRVNVTYTDGRRMIDIRNSDRRLVSLNNIEVLGEEDWRKHIGDGVLCWVWRTGDERAKILLVVKDYRSGLSYPYRTAVPSMSYDNATPMTEKGAAAFINKYLYKGDPS